MDSKLVKDDILKECLNLCKLNNSELVFCCESGSRSWGYSSETSDYDVRGIYIRKRSEYVYSLFGKENDKGVLEIEIKSDYEKNMILFFGILKKLLICILKMEIKCLFGGLLLI